MKTINETYRKCQLAAVLAKLIEESRWFEVEPHPFDVYMVTVKAEGHPLPAPRGLDELGNEVQFPVWYAGVQIDVGDNALTADDEHAYRAYFSRGLTPTEAIKQYKLNDEEF